MGSEIFFPLAQFWYIRPQECVLLFQTGINVILQIPLVMVDTVILCMSWFWPTKTCIDKINNNRIDSKYLWWRSDRLSRWSCSQLFYGNPWSNEIDANLEDSYCTIQVLLIFSMFKNLKFYKSVLYLVCYIFFLPLNNLP